MTLTEREINAWQNLAHACFHGGKIWGGQWTVRLVGRCPATGEEVVVTVRGETLADVRMELLQDETLQRLLANPKVRMAIGLDKDASSG